MERRPDRHKRLQDALAAVIMVVYLAIAWQAREPSDLDGADELEYWALSKSMEQGSYREIFQPGAPLAVKYPPAYPAFLMVHRWVAGEHPDSKILANIVLVGAGLLMVFACVRQFAGGWLALGVLLVTAVNPFVLIYASSLMSEAPYFFLTSAALYAAFMAEQSRRWAPPLAIAFTVLAFLTRTAGVTIVVAMAIWFAIQRPRRELFMYLAAVGIVVGGWFAFSALAPHEGAGSYGRDLADAGVQATSSAVPGVLERVGRSGLDLATRTAVSTFAMPTVGGTTVDNFVLLALFIVLVPAGLFSLWKSWRALSIYLVLYCGLLLAWPYPNARLLVVIVPGLTVAMAMGARDLANRVSSRVGGPAVAALLALMLVGAIPRDLERARVRAACDRDNPVAANSCYTVPEQGMIKAANYLKEHARPDDLVVSSKAPSVYYLSGRLTVPFRRVSNLKNGAIVDTLRAHGIRYVMLGQFIMHEDRNLAQLLMPRCREMQVAWNGLPTALLVVVLPPGEVSDGACEEIAEFRRKFTDAP